MSYQNDNSTDYFNLNEVQDSPQSHPDAELFDYLRSSVDAIKQLCPTPESKRESPEKVEQVLASLENVLNELSGKELTCATSQRCSKMVEFFLNCLGELGEVVREMSMTLKEESSSETNTSNDAERLFSRFLKALIVGKSDGGDRDIGNETSESCELFVLLAKNQYSSHVLETLLGLLPRKFPQLLIESESNNEIRTLLTTLVKSLSKNDEKFRSLCSDPCGTHVARTLLTIISGWVPDSKASVNKKKKKQAQMNKSLQKGKGGGKGKGKGKGSKGTVGQNAHESENHNGDPTKTSTSILPKNRITQEGKIIPADLTMLSDSSSESTIDSQLLLSQSDSFFRDLFIQLIDALAFTSSDLTNTYLGPVLCLVTAISGDALKTEKKLKSKSNIFVKPLKEFQKSMIEMFFNDKDSTLSSNSESDTESTLDWSLKDPVASRVLETCLKDLPGMAARFLSTEYVTKSSDFFGELLKPTVTSSEVNNIGGASMYTFAPFCLQIAISSLDKNHNDKDSIEPTLKSLILNAKWNTLLHPDTSPSHQLVAIKLVEACVRLNCHHKLCGEKVLGVFGIDNHTKVYDGTNKNKNSNKSNLQLPIWIRICGLLTNSVHSSTSYDVSRLPFAGIALLQALLQFPSASKGNMDQVLPQALISVKEMKNLCRRIDPSLNAPISVDSGYTTSHKVGGQNGATYTFYSWFDLLCFHFSTSRLIESIFNDDKVTALSEEAKQVLVDYLLVMHKEGNNDNDNGMNQIENPHFSLLGALGCDPKCGCWIVSSLYQKFGQRDASLREKIAQRLIANDINSKSSSDGINGLGSAMFKCCDLNRYKIDKNGWEEENKRVERKYKMYMEMKKEMEDSKGPNTKGTEIKSESGDGTKGLDKSIVTVKKSKDKSDKKEKKSKSSDSKKDLKLSKMEAKLLVGTSNTNLNESTDGDADNMKNCSKLKSKKTVNNDDDDDDEPTVENQNDENLQDVLAIISGGGPPKKKRKGEKKK